MNNIYYIFYVSRIRNNAPKKKKEKKAYYNDIAQLLDISYFTLMGKLNGYGNFTQKQYKILNSHYSK